MDFDNPRVFECEVKGDLSENQLSRICHTLANRMSTQCSSEPQHDPEEHLKATEMASSAIQVAHELIAKGKTVEAMGVVKHFRQHEAFGHLSPEYQEKLNNVLNTLIAILIEQRDGEEEHSKVTETDLDEPEELVPGVTAPAITGGTPVSAYLCGDYRAVVSTNIQSIGPIQYPYVMTICLDQSRSPVMFVTAESNTIAPEILKVLAETELDFSDVKLATEHFLGIFDTEGHHTLGQFEEISMVEGFTAIALSTMREHLRLEDEPHQI